MQKVFGAVVLAIAISFVGTLLMVLVIHIAVLRKSQCGVSSLHQILGKILDDG